MSSGDRGIDVGLVALLVGETAVVGKVVPDERRVGGNGFQRIDHHRPLLDLDQHGFGGVKRGRFRLRDDHGDRVADIAHVIDRQRIEERNAHLATIRTRVPAARLYRREAGGLEIRTGDDGEDLRHSGRRVAIDDDDPARSHLRADEDRHGLALGGEVVHIAAAAGDQRVILETQL
ncbi:hypothetical protein ABIA23_004991 [Sinorhizobium fredii]